MVIVINRIYVDELCITHMPKRLPLANNYEPLNYNSSTKVCKPNILKNYVFSSFSSTFSPRIKNTNGSAHTYQLHLAYYSVHHTMYSCSGHTYVVTEIKLDCLTFIIIEGEYMSVWVYADTRYYWGYTRNGPCQGMWPFQKIIIKCTEFCTVWIRC